MRESLKEWGKDAVLAGMIVLVLYFFFWPVRIEGSSMKNSFYNGDKVVVSRVLTMLHQYEKGDILVFVGQDGEKEIRMIKRVVALEGEHIEIHDGQVSVNQQVVTENYAIGKTCGDLDIIVPRGEVFFMGDNRENSFDSREMGTIPVKQLQGKVIFRWYPPQKMEHY